MAKVKRHELLLLSINKKKRFTLKELAEEFKVSTRTIQRDLLSLMDMGLPIVSEFGPHGGYKLENERILPPIGFTESEALAFLFALQPYKKSLSFPFRREAVSGHDKFINYLPDDAVKRFEEIQKRLLIHLPSYPDPVPFLPLFLDASLEQCLVTAHYELGGNTKLGRLQPIGIYCDCGSWYSPCYSHTENEFQVIDLKDVKQAAIQIEHQALMDFSEVTITNWPDLLPPSKKLQLHIKLEGEGIQKALRHPSLSSHVIQETDDSGLISMYILTNDIHRFAELIWSLGSDALVVQPAEIAEIIRKKTELMSRNYERIQTF
ncbi:WYL domain-containing protein [Fictibacillus sp. B-59209]|uniref:helix-turn-helix transcriptional regulator n=1 Tax=Fictibacillus sp. B-59209 TaxID=3024873 RepID=UPI002E23A5AF|nr:WYL domain-containing protein [Fictibacillus sp. B-59209]